MRRAGGEPQVATPRPRGVLRDVLAFAALVGAALLVAGAEPEAVPAEPTPPLPAAKPAAEEPTAPEPMRDLSDEDKKAVEDLLDKLSASPVDKRSAIREAIRKQGPGAGTLAEKRLKSADGAFKDELVALLLELRQESFLPAVLEALDAYKGQPPAAVVVAAAKFPNEGLAERIAGWLKDPDFPYRGPLFSLVQHQKSPKVLLPLVEALADPNWRYRNPAKAALVQFGRMNPGSPDFPKALEEGMKSDKEAIRVECLKIATLSSLKSVSFAVRTLFQDSSPSVRKNVAEYLYVCRMNDRDTLNVLAGLLKDADPDCRGMAAKALGELVEKPKHEVAQGDVPYIQALVEVLTAEATLEAEALGLGEPGKAKAEACVAAQKAMAEALFQITGQNEGTNPARWKIWLENFQAKPAETVPGVEPPAEAPPGTPPETP